MQFEKLESRRLLAAATYTFKTGVLTVTGGSKADTINIIENNGSVHLEITDPAHKVNINTDLTGLATQIKINGGGQDDQVFYRGNSIGAIIHGNGGNDSITVGDYGSGSSQVFGDVGDDGITLLRGRQTSISGGSGNDTIFLNTDTSYTDGTSTTDAGKGDDTVVVYSGTNTINGSDGKDTVIIDVAPSDQRDQNLGGAADPNLQTLIKIEFVSYI